MAKARNWLPAKREAQLTMAKCWLAALQVQAAAWGAPEAVRTELLELVTARGWKRPWGGQALPQGRILRKTVSLKPQRQFFQC
jgi:hypothetical protein